MPQALTLTIPAAPPFSPSQGAETVLDELVELREKILDLKASLEVCEFKNVELSAEVLRLRIALAERDERLRLAADVCFELSVRARRLEKTAAAAETEGSS